MLKSSLCDYSDVDILDNCSKTSGSLWEYCKVIPAVNNNDDISDFNETNVIESFNFK